MVRGPWEPTIAEAKAILFAMKTATSCGYNEVLVENDCLTKITIYKDELLLYLLSL